MIYFILTLLIIWGLWMIIADINSASLLSGIAVFVVSLLILIIGVCTHLATMDDDVEYSQYVYLMENRNKLAESEKVMLYKELLETNVYIVTMQFWNKTILGGFISDKVDKLKVLEIK